jgi:dihydrofolate reductase
VPRLIYNTATTLNGFLATEDDSLEWLFAVPGGDSGGASIERFMAGVGVLVEGASTYEWVLRHEHLLDQPSRWHEFYGERPTWIFTHRDLPRVEGADIRFASGSVAESWPEIAAAAGDLDVWVVGGGELVGQFADAGLLDEIRLSVAPASLVAGKPLLPRDLGADRLELVSVERSGQFAELVYRVR